jgi:TM2 domain-containing membrane protein YozV
MPFCPSCGKEVMANESFCWSCGAPLPARGQPAQVTGAGYPMGPVLQAKPRNGWLALLLSFVFPGLGQYYMGQRTRGRWFIVIAAILAVTVLVGVGVILYTLFWLYNMIDAFQTVRKVKAGLPPG